MSSGDQGRGNLAAQGARQPDSRGAAQICRRQHALTDLAGFYRDVLVLQLNAGVDIANTDREADIRALAAHSSPESMLRRLDAILGCRELLDANANPLLSLESLMLRLRAG